MLSSSLARVNELKHQSDMLARGYNVLLLKLEQNKNSFVSLYI